MSEAFDKNLEALKGALGGTGTQRSLLADETIASIETMEDFVAFFAFLEEDLDALVPFRESYLADDYFYAFAMTLKMEHAHADTVYNSMRSDLARVAWCLFLALTTE